MFRIFYPDEYLKSAYEIDYKKLKAEGYKAVLFDIDNTLVRHDADASQRSIKLMNEIHALGMRACVISNNDIERVKSFADAIGVAYIENAQKPLTKNYKKAMDMLDSDTSNTIFIGDQIFTDIFGAKRAGIRTILVKPIHPKEEIQIVLKRYLESIVLHFYKKDQLKKGKNYAND